MTTAPVAGALYAAHVAHLEALRRQRRAASTIRIYGLYIGGFVRFLTDRGIECPTLEHLTPDWIGKYQDHIHSHSQGTRGGVVAERHAVTMLKIFSRWLWRRGLLPNDPLARVEPPRLAKFHRSPFTEADVRALLEAARLGPNPVMERALLLLTLDTGCRVGELVSVEIGDLDLDTGLVIFRKTKNGRPRRVFFGVAGKPDGGPCIVALREWLAIRPRTETMVLFVSRHGASLSTDSVRRIYRLLGESAGVTNCHPHRGRHTAASEFLSELPGAELHLRNRLGHVSADVLADYITISDQTARHVAETASLSAKWDL